MSSHLPLFLDISLQISIPGLSMQFCSEYVFNNIYKSSILFLLIRIETYQISYLFYIKNQYLQKIFFAYFSIISVKAKSFADREIRYTLKAQGQGAGTFNIGPTSGIVKLAKELDFEDLRQPHVYSLVVTATEDSGGFSTSVEVYIYIYLILVTECKIHLSYIRLFNII